MSDKSYTSEEELFDAVMSGKVSISELSDDEAKPSDEKNEKENIVIESENKDIAHPDNSGVDSKIDVKSEPSVVDRAKSDELDRAKSDELGGIQKSEFLHLKRQLGMIPELQKQIARLTSDLENARSVISAPAKQNGYPTQSTNDVDKQEEDVDVFSSASFRSIKEDWPDLAEALLKQHQSIKRELNSLKSEYQKSSASNDPDLKSKIDEISNKIAESERLNDVRALTSKHPDWNNHIVFNSDGSGFEHMSPQFAGFWYGILTNEDRVSVMRNAGDLDTCIALMDDFKSSLSNGSQQTRTLDVEKISKLDRAVSPEVRGTPSIVKDNTSNMTEEDLWQQTMPKMKVPFYNKQ